jgi:S-adenosylmethionine hydrolase
MVPFRRNRVQTVTWLVLGGLLWAAGENGPVAAEVRPNGLVVLLTDYGTEDFYVGALKGAIYRAFPGARIDSITHEVPAFDIREGAYLLVHAAAEFPPGTTFVGIVDPGVGTARKPIAAETQNGLLFVAPDNGLLTLVFRRFGVKRVHEIRNPAVLRQGVRSSTFHGRDIFGPAAGHLASGFPLRRVGPQLEKWVTLKVEDAVREGSEVRGEVQHVDHYGNLLTNIPRSLLETLGLQPGDPVAVTLGQETRWIPFVRTYGDVPAGTLLLTINSLDLVEIAVNMGRAVQTTGATAGTAVRLGKPVR